MEPDIKETKKQSNDESNIDNQSVTLFDDKINEIAVLLTKMTSFIEYKGITKEQEAECRQLVNKWFEDISKVKFCKEVLDILTQCENFKIIFDFDSELKAIFYDCTVPESPYIGGTITIGAKLTSIRTEQDIKGVLARELCLLALNLTFESTSHPYYSHDIIAAQNIKQIIEKISNWTSEDIDKSSGIISSVIKSATPTNIEMELLATVVQILVQFDDDKEELMRFEVKFKEIFDFFEIFVLTEMKNLNLKLRENVRKFNRIAGDILPCLELELSELKDVKSLTENNFSIIQTNLPKLLLINIQKSNYKNILISAEKLQSCQELLHNLLAQDSTLNVFMTFTGAEKIDENFKNIFKSTKFTFIVSDNVQCQELAQKLTELSLNPTKFEVNYGWNDLTVDSQKLLLKMKINFQNNSEFSFLDILKDKFNPEDEEVARNFNDIVDDQLLGLMLEGSEIVVNSGQTNEEFYEKVFQEREFVKIRFEKYWNEPFEEEELSQEDLVLDIYGEKIVLISANPGSGKTWSMKYFAKILHEKNPASWVTYVDLKQFSVMLKLQMAKGDKIDFPIFFAETILNLKTKFEAKIFIKMYELGNVFIFLDELDELSPSSAEFIARSAKTFESNEGSQFWIATCGHIEVDLRTALKLDVEYELCELSEENCVDLIAAKWASSEGSEDISDSNQKLAMDLLAKSSSLKFGAIGMPQLCKMIAEITKDDKCAITELTELTIFKEFTQMLYRNWSNLHESGTEANFWTLHELMAVKSLFPNYSEFCDQILDDLKIRIDQDITSAGLVTKNGQTYNFLHSTYADFFIAEFILRTLKQEEVSSWFLQFLMKVLTTRRYQTIRMFLDQGIVNVSDLKLSDKTIKDLTSNIDEFTNISYVFMEGLENLQKFLVMCLNRRRYKVVKSIIESNIEAIFAAMRSSEVPLNPQIFLDFIVKFLNPKCLQNLIKEKKFFNTIIRSCEDIEHFGWFANAVRKKLNLEFVVQNFRGHQCAIIPNIIFAFCWSKNLNQLKVQKFFKILKRLLNFSKITKMLEVKNKRCLRTVLNSSAKRGISKMFRNMWTEMENFYKSNESHQKFKELIMNKGSILWEIFMSNNIKLHEAFWELALETFGKEELRNFINSEKAKFKDTLQFQTGRSKNLHIIEFMCTKLEEIFNNEELTEFFYDTQESGKNILYRAAKFTVTDENFESIWHAMRKFHKTDEKFITFLNSLGVNVLGAALKRPKFKIFNFIIQELKTFASREQIRSLITSNYFILHDIKDEKLFMAVWTLICDYFCDSEILEILQNCNSDDDNFILNYLYGYSDKNIVKDFWEAVKEFIDKYEVKSTEVTENVKNCEIYITQISTQANENDSKNRELLNLKWLKTKSLRLLDCPETLKLQISQSELFSSAYDFHVLANCENFEIHEICWQFILKKYENREDLAKLMTQRSVSGSIFIHSIISNKNIQVIKFILLIIQNNFNEHQIREIFTFKYPKRDSNIVNLLSIAVCDSKSLQIIEILWKMHKNYFSSTELIDIVSQFANPCSKIPIYAAGSSVKIFNFVWSELEKLLCPENSQKLVDLVTEQKLDGQNILRICVMQHDIQLLEVTWNKVKVVLGGSVKSILKLSNDETNYNWPNDIINILKIAIENDNIEFHETLWKLLWENITDKDEFRSLILWKKIKKTTENIKNCSECSTSSDDSSRSSQFDTYRTRDPNKVSNLYFIYGFMMQLFHSANVDVAKLTMQNLDKILYKKDIRTILTCKRYDCFLENKSKNIERHQMLWDIYQQYFTIPDLKYFTHEFFHKVLCTSVTISVEVFKLTWNEAIKSAESIIIPALEVESPIICKCLEQNDKEMLKIVWMEVKKFYEEQNLSESFKEFLIKRSYYGNIFEYVSKLNELEMHEMFWELLLLSFENREELMNVLIRKDEFYGCLVSEFFINSHSKSVQFLIKMLQENFTESQLQELISADNTILYNCLSIKKFEIFKIWWEFFKKIFNNSQKFVEFLAINGNFNTIFGYGCEDTLELLFNDLKSFTTRDKIKKFFLETEENILHVALKRGNDNEYEYEISWQYIHEYLEKDEIYELLCEIDENESTFLFHVVDNYSEEMIEISWNEMKKVLSYEEQVEFLKEKHPKNGNLFQFLPEYSRNRSEKMELIERIFRETKVRINK